MPLNAYPETASRASGPSLIRPYNNDSSIRLPGPDKTFYHHFPFQVIPKTEEGIEFGALSKAVVPYLSQELVDSTSPGRWTTTVKLDLEARKLIERVPGKGRQRVRRA